MASPPVLNPPVVTLALVIRALSNGGEGAFPFEGSGPGLGFLEVTGAYNALFQLAR